MVELWPFTWGIKRLGAIIEQIKNYTSEDYPIAVVLMLLAIIKK